jgi:hypothetical protein
LLAGNETVETAIHTFNSAENDRLQAENDALKALLEVMERRLSDKDAHIADLRRLLPPVDAPPPKRRFWQRWF